MGQGLIRLRGGRRRLSRPHPACRTTPSMPYSRTGEGDLWIGCEDGLVRLTRRSGTNIGSQDGLEDDDVLTVYPDAQDNLWITTLTGQVYRFPVRLRSGTGCLGPPRIFKSGPYFRTSDGTFWFGTAGSGVVRQEGQAVTVYTKADGLRSNMVRQILEDRSGAIWIALDSGLSRWDGRSFKNYYLQDGLSYPSTRCMITDLRGDVLVGTDAGLNRVHDGQIVRDDEFAALANEKIWAIYQDSGGTLWLGTRGGGLLRFRSGRALRFTRENGLLTNTIFQILGDRRGKIWMSTSSGMISADRKELDAAADGSTQSIHVIPYGTADGMATSQMNGGIQPAGAITAAGDLWFPSVKGAVRISPSRVPLAARRAGTDRENRGRTTSRFRLSTEITVPPGHGRLAIDFTLCELADPQRFSFRYKLEGFDDRWTPALRGRSASYTNLPPRPLPLPRDGQRRRVLERLGSRRELSTLRPHFYQTEWLYGLLVLLAAGMVIWGGFALYARQTRARYALLLTERARLAREMHDTVIQGCVGVSTLLEAAARFRDLDAGGSGNAARPCANPGEEHVGRSQAGRLELASSGSAGIVDPPALRSGSQTRGRTRNSDRDRDGGQRRARPGNRSHASSWWHGKPAQRGRPCEAAARSPSVSNFEPSERFLEVADDGSASRPNARKWPEPALRHRRHARAGGGIGRRLLHRQRPGKRNQGRRARFRLRGFAPQRIYSSTIPRRSAVTAAAVRSATLSRVSTILTCHFTVDCEIPSVLGDFLVAHALDDQLQHLAFALAQLGIRRPIGQCLENRRRQVAQSKMHIAYGVDKLMRRHALEQVSLGACLQRADRYLRLLCK